MTWSIWIRFSVMMLFQYLVWGAWGDYLPVYLGTLNFTSVEIGWVMSMLFFASMFAPFIGGQITDRWMDSEKYLGLSQLACGVLMFIMAGMTSFWPFLILMFVWSVFYAPTLPLTNAICFRNLNDVEREFGSIRFWGTIGWIVAGFALTYLLTMSGDGASCLRLSGAASIVMGVFSFVLPNTPPKKDSDKPFAFLEALKLFKDPTFAAFMGISFIVATELMFYYVLTGPFLKDLGIQEANIPSVMRLAQIAELFSLIVLLPWILPRTGIKWAMMIGIIAWPIRYIIFAIGTPTWLVVASLPLHGLCYVFFFVVGQIYVDKAAPEEIRGSAQSLWAFVVFGLGLTFGSVFAGWIQSICSEVSVVNGVTTTIYHWRTIFIIPVVLTVLCAILFLVQFHEPQKKIETGEPVN